MSDRYGEDMFDKILSGVVMLLAISGTAFIILLMAWASVYIIRDILAWGC